MFTEPALREVVGPIAGAFLLAWLVHRSAGRIVGRFVRLSAYAPERFRIRQERQQTLHDLFSSGVSFLAFLLAGIFTLGIFIDTTTLAWTVGLFSAAFGLGARPLISDYLTGVSFIFEDTFDVGEKIEVLHVEGVVERINLRTTQIRGTEGEVFTIPNGEMRVIRNFSRGRFSSTNITLKIGAADLEPALALLEEFGTEAVALLPNLLEPWQVISPTGVISQHTELTLVVKVRFGKASELRPRLLALVQKRLGEAEISLAD